VASPEDLAGIAAVHLATRRTAYRQLLPTEVLEGMSATTLHDWWRLHFAHATGPHQMLVATPEHDPREVIGFAYVCAGERGLGELFAIHVHPRAQGSGVGAQLLLAACHSLRDMAYPRARLWVLEGNQNAQGFYRRHGWRLVEGAHRMENIDGTLVPEVAYDRELVPD
jgi:ribosomal protein S18 acetylase RimI-like enzyme